MLNKPRRLLLLPCGRFLRLLRLAGPGTCSFCQNDPIIGAYEAKYIAGDLLDDVFVRQFRAKQRNILAIAGSGGLEALNLKFEERLLLEELSLRLEAVPAIFCVISEISRQPRANKQDKDLPGEHSPIMNGSTQHLFVLRTQ